MLKPPEQFYDQHRKDAEGVEKAQSTYDKHLEEAREAGDLTKHPELWDQASLEYQAEAKEKIAEAVKAENYDVAEEMIRDLRAHLDTNKEIEERGNREGLDKDDWELLQSYRKGIESLVSEISGPLTKKKMLRKSALLFDKTGSIEYSDQQQLIECALLAIELERAANQEGIGFSVSSFRNPREMSQHKTLNQKVDARGTVQIIKQLERRDGEGPTEEAEHLEKVFAEFSTQGEKDGKEYPKDIVYFTDGETSSPQKTREVLEKIGQLINVDVVLMGGASKETARVYQGVKGVRVTVVPLIEKLPFAFGELLKAKYAPELLVGKGEAESEISESKAEARAKVNIEKMAEVEPREEIQRMVTEKDWNHAKSKVLGRIDSIRDLSQLAHMRTFDPKRFDEDFDVERLWGRIREIVRREEGNPIYYLIAARDLKLVSKDSDRFLQEVNGLILDKAVEEIRQRKHFPKEFLVLASAFKDIDPEKFQQMMGNDVSEVWPQIAKFIEEMPPVCRPYYIGLAQSIKPDSEPDLTVNKRVWSKYKQELEYSLHRRYDFENFFRAANKVSHLKLEEEK